MKKNFEISIKSTEIEGKVNVKIIGTGIVVMNGLANLINALKEQSILDESDIRIAVEKGLKGAEKSKQEDEEFVDKILKNILGI